ncbi:hypothetical protein T4A_10818 [Trichinella pseudospiralis]|uniref:Uncharacterized protein n=1 Tax=Trichinella pseudospiralis TaxID=6337 RepID=A0A0V1DTR1_TRIPS|nr:hypothetical protein T4A_6688 [Trichinella pseudospiralis]KRY64769.1 hypothetical protein T4A_10818 [Trichinella pseudospiralis]
MTVVTHVARKEYGFDEKRNQNGSLVSRLLRKEELHYINNKTITQRNSTFNWQKRLVSVKINKSLEKSGRCLFHTSDFNYNCKRSEPGNEDGYARAKKN